MFFIPLFSPQIARDNGDRGFFVPRVFTTGLGPRMGKEWVSLCVIPGCDFSKKKICLICFHAGFLSVLISRCPFIIAPILFLRFGRDATSDSFRFV